MMKWIPMSLTNLFKGTFFSTESLNCIMIMKMITMQIKSGLLLLIKWTLFKWRSRYHLIYIMSHMKTMKKKQNDQLYVEIVKITMLLNFIWKKKSKKQTFQDLFSDFFFLHHFFSWFNFPLFLQIFFFHNSKLLQIHLNISWMKEAKSKERNKNTWLSTFFTVEKAKIQTKID